MLRQYTCGLDNAKNQEPHALLMVRITLDVPNLSRVCLFDSMYSIPPIGCKMGSLSTRANAGGPFTLC
jgi:hypothetical protein